MFQGLSPTLQLAKIQQIISIKKGILMSNPKQVKYLSLWDPDIWIPNLLYSNEKNNLPILTTEHKNNKSTMLNLAESFMNPQRSYLLGTFHIIREFLTLIPENSNSLFVIRNTKDRMTLSAYRKLIKQGMLDMNINKSFGPYSLN
jgi:hypothetical protein